MEIIRLHLARIETFHNLPVHGFVIKHPRAGAILVDTGVGWSDELIKEWKVVNRRVADVLGEHDLSPADVRIVINTHLHLDHCGQNAVFKHAPFYVHRHELTRARREEKLATEWFDFAGAKFELVDGDAEVADGVRVVSTPGHTIGHQSVVVDTAHGSAVMIGDAAYTSDIYREPDQADHEDWHGQYTDRVAWLASLIQLRAMHSDVVHFCHDARIVSPEQ